MGCIEYYTLLPGEERVIPLRAVYSDQSPINLTGVTEIIVRFKRKDGNALIKSMTGTDVLIVDPLAGRYSVKLSSDDTRSLKKGERQDFTAVIYRGIKGSYSEVVGYTPTPVPFVWSARYPGVNGNVTLTFDGTSTIDQILEKHNYDNPEQPVSISLPLQGVKIPPAGNITLAGGTDTGTRPINYYRMITVEGLSI
jgi:hypothetical protein